MADDSAGWISAKMALEALTADGRSPHEIEAMLAAYLRNGSLRAYAGAIWKSDARFTTQAWKDCPQDAQGGPVPKKYWRFEKAIGEDRLQWRFVANRFLATTRLKPRRRIMMKGVQFSRSDLQRLQPKTFGFPPDKKKRGKPVEIEKRDAAWLALIDVIFDKTRAIGTIRNKAELELEIETARDREGSVFGEKTCEEVARQAFDRLRRYDAI